MGAKARNYTPLTLKRLFALSGNQCSFPGCNKTLVNTVNAKDSNIAHIEGANVGSERYNPLLSDLQRADYPNLILLCVQHHDETNDVSKFTVDVLQKMKSNHESAFAHQRIERNPSMLKNTINAIAAINLNETLENQNLNSIDPKEKIKYNLIKENVAFIEEYKVYYKKLNSLYDELELQGSIKKEKLLNNIRSIYIKIKGRYVLDSDDPIEVIKQNSDKIINEIYDELYTKMEESNLFDEDIVLGIRLIMVDAFIRCKILEEPIDDSK